MSGLIAWWRHYVERKRIQPDLNRALRCTVAFMGPLLAGLRWHLPVETTFAALAAQNLALVDIRGSYPLRFSLLLAMTAVMAGACWLGGATAGNLPLALVAIAATTLLGGAWRRLSAEYGPSLASGSIFLVLLALAEPGGGMEASRHFLAALVGGLWGVVVQVSLWPFRAEHPLRRTVAESWLALADLMAAMAPADARTPEAQQQEVARHEASLRTILDQTTAALSAAHAGRVRPHLRELEELNTAAARLSTRFVSFSTALEALSEEPGFGTLAPSLGPVLTSLTNTARSVALTVVSRQPSHLATAEVRLRRLANLLQALQDRVRTQTGRSAAGEQLAGILQQIGGLLPEIGRILRSTIDRADERAAFSLELFDLQTWTLRPLASALNFQWKPDPALNRFIVRLAVLQVFGVAVFKFFALSRGYWLPLTVLVVMQPDYGSTRLRASQRALGTLAGSLLASLLLWLSLPHAVLLVALAATMFGFAYWLKRNYAVAVFFITLFVVLITEVSTTVTVAFTVERLASTLAGVLLALLATMLFWPVWERQVYPGIIARALRANAGYLRLLGDKIATGGRYEGPVVSAKRAVEAANSVVFASLQRMFGDPKNQQASLEAAAALANGNQRLSRAFTVVALHLTSGVPLHLPAFARFVALGSETLEVLAVAATSAGDAARFAHLRAELDGVAFPPMAITGSGPTGQIEHSAATQFARCATELSAMLLAASAEGPRPA
jgi:uncharacterized membrane protein YccC